MTINLLFAAVAASTADGKRRRRMYGVLRTVLRNRSAWGIENTATDLVHKRDFVASRLSTQPQVRALHDVVALALVARGAPSPSRVGRAIRAVTVLFANALVVLLLVASVRHVAITHTDDVDRWPGIVVAEMRGITSIIVRKGLQYIPAPGRTS